LNPEYKLLLSVTSTISSVIIVDDDGNIAKKIILTASPGFVYDKLAALKL
jgi:hypothetical protein